MKERASQQHWVFALLLSPDRCEVILVQNSCAFVTYLFGENESRRMGDVNLSVF